MTYEEIYQLGKKLKDCCDVNIFDYIEILGTQKSDKAARFQNLIYLVNTEKMEKDLNCADKDGVSIKDAMLEKWGEKAVDMFELLMRME